MKNTRQAEQQEDRTHTTERNISHTDYQAGRTLDRWNTRQVKHQAGRTPGRQNAKKTGHQAAEHQAGRTPGR